MATTEQAVTITLTLTDAEVFALNTALTIARDALTIKRMNAEMAGEPDRADIAGRALYATARVHRQLAENMRIAL